MKVTIKTLLLGFVLGLLLFDLDAHAATACNDWADFTQIIAYRFRDNYISREKVKTELEKVKGGDPEMSIAQSLIDYSYAHPEKDAAAIWHGVYEQCLKENAI
jgi:hypothetical protein